VISSVELTVGDKISGGAGLIQADTVGGGAGTNGFTGVDFLLLSAGTSGSLETPERDLTPFVLLASLIFVASSLHSSSSGVFFFVVFPLFNITLELPDDSSTVVGEETVGLLFLLFSFVLLGVGPFLPFLLIGLTWLSDLGLSGQSFQSCSCPSMRHGLFRTKDSDLGLFGHLFQFFCGYT